MEPDPGGSAGASADRFLRFRQEGKGISEGGSGKKSGAFHGGFPYGKKPFRRIFQGRPETQRGGTAAFQGCQQTLSQPGRLLPDLSLAGQPVPQ